MVSPDQTLRNLRVPRSLLARPDAFGGVRDQDCQRGDLVIRDGRVAGMTAPTGESALMLLPALTECHVHLDKCHTIHRMEGIGGDLMAAIEAQGKDHEQWTFEDFKYRATKGLNELITAGCQTVRSHVDWHAGGMVTEAPLAWHVLNELAQDFRSQVTLQKAPLTGADDLVDPITADTIARGIAEKGGVLGVFVYDQPERRLGIQQAFRVAEKFGLALDFHVDEGMSPDLDGLEIIAETAIATEYAGPVLCGHACSLMNRHGDELARLINKIAESGIHIASLPSTNLYLQGRAQGTPDRRGLTRIHELQNAGVNVVVGTDNVQDAFCPLGRHDPRQSLAFAALAAHLDPPFGDHLPMITTNARRALGLAPINVDGAAIGDLMLFDATSTSDLLAGITAPKPLADVLSGDTK